MIKKKAFIALKDKSFAGDQKVAKKVASKNKTGKGERFISESVDFSGKIL